MNGVDYTYLMRYLARAQIHATLALAAATLALGPHR